MSDIEERVDLDPSPPTLVSSELMLPALSIGLEFALVVSVEQELNPSSGLSGLSVALEEGERGTEKHV